MKFVKGHFFCHFYGCIEFHILLCLSGFHQLGAAVAAVFFISISQPGDDKKSDLDVGKLFREIDGKRFFLTGDIGHMDEEGYFIITDRKKDLVLVGGFNVYPREVEDILFTHPKVAIAAVVGIPDDKGGEMVKAFIQLKPDEKATKEEILDFCKENMAGYKRPKALEFRDVIPVSNIGKVLRRVLRDEEVQKKKD